MLLKSRHISLLKYARRPCVTTRHYTSSSHKTDWRILFFGTGDVALSSLSLLHARKDLVSRLELICPPQKSTKIVQPTSNYAMKNNIPIHRWHPKKLPSSAAPHSIIDQGPYLDTIERMKTLIGTGFDIGVVVDFGYMIPGELISAFPKPPILMHPSLLPQYRGAAPIECAIMNGDSESGVTVLEVATGKFDAGMIYSQRKYTMDPRATGHKIRQDLSSLGAQTLVEVLEQYDMYFEHRMGQSLECTKAPKLIPRDYVVSWENASPERIYHQWRALGPLTTGLHGCKSMSIRSEDGILGILLHDLCFPGDVQPTTPQHLSDRSDAPPGTIIFDKSQNLIWAKCGRQSTTSTISSPPLSWLGIRSLQFDSGRRVIDAASFINGIQLKGNLFQRFGPPSPSSTAN